MPRLAFSLFSGGPAQSATVLVDGNVQVVDGPVFDFTSGEGATFSEVAFTRINFPTRVIAVSPFDSTGSVAQLNFSSQALPAGVSGPLDVNGDGILDSTTLRLNQTFGGPPRVDISAFAGDALQLSGWQQTNVDLGANQQGGSISISGPREGTVNTGAGADTVSVATATDGTGLFTISTDGGSDAVRLDVGQFYQGQALVALGDGNDRLQATGPAETTTPTSPVVPLGSSIATSSAPAESTAAAGTAADTGIATTAEATPTGVVQSAGTLPIDQMAQTTGAAAQPTDQTAQATDQAAQTAGAGTTGQATTGAAQAVNVPTVEASSIFPPFFPPSGTTPGLAMVADGGAGADRFILSNLTATVTGGEGNDSVDLGNRTTATVTPGLGQDTVTIHEGASGTVVIGRGETGPDLATADTLRFEGPGATLNTTLALTGFSPQANVVLQAFDSSPTLDEASVIVTDPTNNTTDVIQLLGVNSSPLDALSIVFV